MARGRAGMVCVGLAARRARPRQHQGPGNKQEGHFRVLGRLSSVFSMPEAYRLRKGAEGDTEVRPSMESLA